MHTQMQLWKKKIEHGEVLRIESCGPFLNNFVLHNLFYINRSDQCGCIKIS